MGDTQRQTERDEARDAAAVPSLADASARFIADQTAAMTVMTAVSVNLAAQMAGIFMGAMANALQGSAEERRDEKQEKRNIVALRVVKGAEPPKADDLKRISGIGPRLEKVLNGMGIRTFADIAKCTAADMRRIDDKLGLDNRTIRDDWVKQAKALLEG
jgi:NADH-quinone oxidoreductase subunit E